MKIQREDFLNKLEMVKAGLSPREFIEQSSCFVFQNGHVMTFNDEVACRMRLTDEDQPPVSITGAIQADTLLTILGKLNDEELLLLENEKGELEFKGKKKRFGVTKDAEIFLPIDRVDVPKKWIEIPKDFTEGVGLVQSCVSTDESKFLLTCVHLHPDYIEACDNLQIIRYRIKTGLDEAVLVRGTSLAHITSLGMDKMARTKCWLHFKNQAGLIFSCRVYAEEYPSMEAAMTFKGRPVSLPKGVKDAADRASVFASDRSGEALVDVTIREGSIKVLGEGLTGWYREAKSIEYTGEPMRFSIAPSLLAHICEKYSDAELSATKLKVQSNRWIYITVLGSPIEKEEESPAPPKKKKEGKEKS